MALRAKYRDLPLRALRWIYFLGDGPFLAAPGPHEFP
jgi:hypothetical protein